MCLNGDSWCFCVKKRWWLGKHEKHVFFSFFRGLSKSCIFSWWLSKLSRWTTLSRTNTRFVSARARARVRARAETHRVIVLGLTTRPSRDPIFGPLLERVCHRSPRIRSIFGLEGEKRGPKMTLFWGTGIPGSWDTGNWTTFGSYYDIS